MNGKWEQSRLPDHELIAGYELQEKIGEGGGGFVYKAIQQSTGQFVAVKILKENLTTNELLVHRKARFELETQICAEINHPNIVRLLDKGMTSDQIPFAVFELVSGTTLKDYIMLQQGLSPQVTGQIMLQVMEALVFAHGKGIVHRDLKPHNIMVKQEGDQIDVKVLDFGIGALADDRHNLDTEASVPIHEVVGTPLYSAPEQLRGEPPTLKSDLYAWGLIFLECLTGQPVVSGHSTAVVIQEQLSSKKIQIPVSLQQHALSDLLGGVLTKDSDQRYADGAAIVRTLSAMDYDQIQPIVIPVSSGVTDFNTEINDLNWEHGQQSNKVMLLGFRIEVIAGFVPESDQRSLQSIYEERIAMCQSIAKQYGGTVCGRLAGQVLIRFDKSTPNPAYRVGMSALEIVNQLWKKNREFYTTSGIKLTTSVALHTGEISQSPVSVAESMAAVTAMRLLQEVPADSILLSDAIVDFLVPYFVFEVPVNRIPTIFGISQVFELIEVKKGSSTIVLAPEAIKSDKSEKEG